MSAVRSPRPEAAAQLVSAGTWLWDARAGPASQRLPLVPAEAAPGFPNGGHLEGTQDTSPARGATYCELGATCARLETTEEDMSLLGVGGGAGSF